EWFNAFGGFSQEVNVRHQKFLNRYRCSEERVEPNSYLLDDESEDEIQSENVINESTTQSSTSHRRKQKIRWTQSEEDTVVKGYDG
uniref:Uncharacterized protein n=1 Tax=Wuchereria bancrofti TaxID=6293 RepID=A0A1I8EUU7_WUCBA